MAVREVRWGGVLVCGWLTLACGSSGGDTADGGASDQDGGAGAGGGAGGGGGEGGGGGGAPIDTSVPQEGLSPEPVYALDGIHVSPDGDDDGGDGSPAAPYRTIPYVLENVAGPDDTILLHEGTYTGEIRIRHAGLTLQSAMGERAHLQCEVNIDENAPITCIEVDAEADRVTLRGLEVEGGFYAIYIGSQWDYDDTPLDNLTATDVLIEDCILHGTGRDVVKIPSGCDDVTIRRTEIYDSGLGYPAGTSVEEMNAEGIDAVNADRAHFSDLYVHDIATSCIYVKGGSIGTVIERVRAERCGEIGLALGSDSSPEWFDTEVNPEYYENIGGVIRNSFVAETGRAGLGLYATRDGSLLHNTVRNAARLNQAGIFLGVVTQDYSPIAGRPANVNPTIIGNIVDQSGADGSNCMGIRYSVEDELGNLSGLDGAMTLRDNLYFSTGTCYFEDGRPDTLLEGADFAAWQAHVDGYDASSRFVDPLLDAEGRPQEGSPAVDALAEPTAGVTYDFEGQMRTGAYDLGADER